MGFASAYLKEKTLFPELIPEAPDKGTGIIVVVPSCNETGIVDLLNSLDTCDRPLCSAEVIIIVNAPGDATKETEANNLKTISDIDAWSRDNPGCFFNLRGINVSGAEKDGWGVGMARKTGMDEAVRRFDGLDRPDGVIVSLDADCTVEKNYFTAIENGLRDRKDWSACSIYFEHPVSGTGFTSEEYRAVILYELHLRYFYQGLLYSGYPYAHHTIGSALALKALLYVKSGGMNRKAAGEDFYFIQKLLPAGGFFDLNSTAVYPSPRRSLRVPFGTGATISRLTVDPGNMMSTYNLQAFSELKSLFEMIDMIGQRSGDPVVIHEILPEGLRQFISPGEWQSKISEIRFNTAGTESFRKRFFGWFNMFRIVKFMNFVHSGLYPKKPVAEASHELLRALGKETVEMDAPELLRYFRKLERDY
ncbi:MAG: hypothetical protein WCE64_06165 [Bacteroidales bacterium]